MQLCTRCTRMRRHLKYALSIRRLGLAAYVIDSIVNEVSSRDADQVLYGGQLRNFEWQWHRS